MLSFPHTFLIGEFWKVPKNEGITRQCHTFPPLVSLPTGPDSGPGHFSQASLELSHPPAAARRLPHQILESLFRGLSLSPARMTYSSGGVELNTTYISSPTPASLPIAPSALKSRNLLQTLKPVRLLMGSDAANSGLSRKYGRGRWAWGSLRPFLWRTSEVLLWSRCSDGGGRASVSLKC